MRREKSWKANDVESFVLKMILVVVDEICWTSRISRPLSIYREKRLRERVSEVHLGCLMMNLSSAGDKGHIKFSTANGLRTNVLGQHGVKLKEDVLVMVEFHVR